MSDGIDGDTWRVTSSGNGESDREGKWGYCRERKMKKGDRDKKRVNKKKKTKTKGNGIGDITGNAK